MSPLRLLLLPALLLTGLFLTGACSDSTGANPATVSSLDVPSTLKITPVPGPNKLVAALPPPVTFEPLPASSTSLGPPPTVPYTLKEGAVANAVDGNRVLLIGDSILASTAPRFDGPMCVTLESFGWSSQIEAEKSKFVEFATVVLDEVLPVDGENNNGSGDDFDVVAIMLGNNYRGDLVAFQTEYDSVLRRVSPRPTIVYTVTEDDADKAALNKYIRDLPDDFDNVLVIDWAAKTAADPKVLLAGDGLHLSKVGRDRLALFTVAALGKISARQTDDAPVKCLDPVFDSNN